MNKNNLLFKDLFLFFGLIFLISWVLWLPSILNSRGIYVSPILQFFGMFANYGPSLGAIILITRHEGRSSGWKFIKSGFKFDFNKQWLPFVCLFIPVLSLLSMMSVIVLQGETDLYYLLHPWMIPILFLQIFFTGGALGEEFGWRGYALPRLQKLYSPLLASLILGLIWSTWHLPLFFIKGSVLFHIPMWQFFLQNTLMTFLYTWVFNRSNGSIFLAMLLHGVANTSSAVFPYWQSNSGRWIGFVLLCIALLMINKSYKLNKTNLEKSSVKK